MDPGTSPAALRGERAAGKDLGQTGIGDLPDDAAHLQILIQRHEDSIRAMADEVKRPKRK